MTREEAILLLHDMKDTYDEIHENTNFEIGYEQMTALDMAIEALSQVRCNDCKWNDDVIEVVRCKDCRHGWYDDDIEYYTCRHPKGLNEELYGVDFCSYGERKE